MRDRAGKRLRWRSCDERTDFQAKSVKQHAVELHREALEVLRLDARTPEAERLATGSSRAPRRRSPATTPDPKAGADGRPWRGYIPAP
jgi:hypothetical protein